MSIAAGGGPVVVLAEEPDTLVTWSPPNRRVDRAAAAITGFTHASTEYGLMAQSDEHRHAIAGDEVLCGARMWLHLTSDAAEVDCPDCRMSR